MGRPYASAVSVISFISLCQAINYTSSLSAHRATAGTGWCGGKVDGGPIPSAPRRTTRMEGMGSFYYRVFWEISVQYLSTSGKEGIV